MFHQTAGITAQDRATLPSRGLTLTELGLVEELVRGRDGIVRGASVRLASKDARHSLLRCSIQRLYPLKAAATEDEHSFPEHSSKAPQEPSSSEPAFDGQTRSRPQRAAALRSESR